MATKTPIISKTELFLTDLQKLLDHYQLALKPALKYLPTGIVPEITLINVPPKEPMKGKNVKPAN